MLQMYFQYAWSVLSRSILQLYFKYTPSILQVYFKYTSSILKKSSILKNHGSFLDISAPVDHAG